MDIVFVPISGPASQLVSAGDGPTLLFNNDPAAPLWIGDNDSIQSTDANGVVPLAPNASLVVDGEGDVFGIADPSATNGQSIPTFVIDGGLSYFQPISQLVIQGSAAGVFIYSPIAGPGTLIGSWSSVAGTDIYGNSFPQGINVSQGLLQGVSIQNSQIVTSTLLNCILNGPSISAAQISGGTMTETTITFDSTAGNLLMYTSTTTTIIFTTPGNTQWTAPSGVSVVRAQCWAAGAGGNGGSNSVGAGGGGGGEYAEEPHYSVVPGNVYSVVVGSGGTGGTANSVGSGGGDTSFDGTNVFANGGDVSTLGNPIPSGGLGGNGSTNTIHFAGGNGGTSSSSGGSGGGSSAGTAAVGNNGTNSNSSAGGAGGTAPVGGAAGGNGGANAANGNAASSPGAGGGGSGESSGTVSTTKTYNTQNTYSYYGSTALQPNGLRNKNGSMYQGSASGDQNVTGYQYSFLVFNASQIHSDLSGVTIDDVKIRLANQHSWYNSGMYCDIGYDTNGNYGSNSHVVPTNTFLATPFIDEGDTTTFDITGVGIGTAFQNGTAKAVCLGPAQVSDYLNYYGYFAGGTNPQLTIKFHTGAAPTQGGNGANGQVSLTYTTGSSLVGAASPIAFNDSFGNAVVAGFMGSINTWHPGSSPLTVEAWQNVTLPTGWTGYIRYRLRADNAIDIQMRCNPPNTDAAGTKALFTIPSSYIPSGLANVFRAAIGYFVNGTPATIGALSTINDIRFDVEVNGNVQINAYPGGAANTGVSEVCGAWRVPID